MNHRYHRMYYILSVEAPVLSSIRRHRMSTASSPLLPAITAFGSLVTFINAFTASARSRRDDAASGAIRHGRPTTARDAGPEARLLTGSDSRLFPQLHPQLHPGSPDQSRQVEKKQICPIRPVRPIEPRQHYE
jgi:hypothetical protein